MRPRGRRQLIPLSNVVWPTNWKARCIWTIDRTALSARSTFPRRTVTLVDKPLSGLRILVVEDEPIIRLGMVSSIEDAGFTVIDLGVDTSADKFIDAVEEHMPVKAA